MSAPGSMDPPVDFTTPAAKASSQACFRTVSTGSLCSARRPRDGFGDSSTERVPVACSANDSFRRCDAVHHAAMATMHEASSRQWRNRLACRWCDLIAQVSFSGVAGLALDRDELPAHQESVELPLH